MTEVEILREALETYINHQAMTIQGFFDYHDHDRNVAGRKMAVAEQMLKDSYGIRHAA